MKYIAIIVFALSVSIGASAMNVQIVKQNSIDFNQKINQADGEQAGAAQLLDNELASDNEAVSFEAMTDRAYRQMRSIRLPNSNMKKEAVVSPAADDLGGLPDEPELSDLV